MRAVILCLALLLLPCKALGGEITEQRFYSETLARDYDYLVYLPDGYNDAPERDYPVVYLLHGSFSNAAFWPEAIDVGTQFNRMIDAGRIPPIIAVMPNAKSWWIDGHNEPAETAFFEDLLPEIESRWRVVADREARFVCGVSAGGYATVNFALKYAHMFGAGAALSPASYQDLPPANSTAYRHPAYLDENGAFDEAMWRANNYPALIDAYRAHDSVVPLYINSGDHDGLDIAYHAAVLYQQLREHQPQDVELRVIDGDHEPQVWVEAFAEAMEFMVRPR